MFSDACVTKRSRSRPAKRPPNAFILFCRNERQTVCDRCPNLSPGDVSSLLSHLWRSLDPESKAHYKQEELRLQSEFTDGSRESMGFPLPSFAARFPFAASEARFPATDWTAALAPPPLIPLAPVIPKSRPAQAITRRFDPRPLRRTFHEGLEMTLPPAPIHGITSDRGDGILVTSWKS
jgi:hypothetical protein